MEFRLRFEVLRLEVTFRVDNVTVKVQEANGQKLCGVQGSGVESRGGARGWTTEVGVQGWGFWDGIKGYVVCT